MALRPESLYEYYYYYYYYYDARILIGLRPATPTNESLETRKWLKSRNGAAFDDASFVH